MQTAHRKDPAGGFKHSTFQLRGTVLTTGPPNAQIIIVVLSGDFSIFLDANKLVVIILEIIFFNSVCFQCIFLHCFWVFYPVFCVLWSFRILFIFHYLQFAGFGLDFHPCVLLSISVLSIQFKLLFPTFSFYASSPTFRLVLSAVPFQLLCLSSCFILIPFCLLYIVFSLTFSPASLCQLFTPVFIWPSCSTFP